MALTGAQASSLAMSAQRESGNRDGCAPAVPLLFFVTFRVISWIVFDYC
jgi:hypothetical protein